MYVIVLGSSFSEIRKCSSKYIRYTGEQTGEP
jgi:hypothetical protein